MSEQAYDGYEHDGDMPQQPGFFATATNWIGALLSISLVVGLAFWGYKLTMRDVTEVPVVRAMEGPLRVQPDDPGGETAAHQGLAVNEVQSSGTVEATSDRVVLAPDPVQLTSEDLALSLDHPKARETTLSGDTINLVDMIAEDTIVDTAEAINNAVKAAVDEAAASPSAKKLAKLPGVKRSPRPRARIVGQDQVVAIAASTSTMTDASAGLVSKNSVDIDVDPALITAGTRLVQLGAFDDRASAIKEWDFIIERHGDLIDGRKRFIQLAESGGRSFFRLRMVGFDNLGDSRRLCSAMLARGTPCIPVTSR